MRERNEGPKRIGWGEPVTLTPEQADAARDLLADTHPETWSHNYDRVKLLRSIFIPPLELCQETRVIIKTAADWIHNISHVPNVEDLEYDAFQQEASSELTLTTEAFRNRPEGCEMEMTEDEDEFSCQRCGFLASTDIMH